MVLGNQVYYVDDIILYFKALARFYNQNLGFIPNLGFLLSRQNGTPMGVTAIAMTEL